MHELSMVAELVQACIDQARPGEPVSTVHVRYATTVPKEVLEEAFAMLTAGTALAGARLDAAPIERVFRCPSCGFQGALQHDDVIAGAVVCPGCGLPSPRTDGPELELLRLS